MAAQSPKLRSEAWQLVKTTVVAWNNDKVPRLGAALAFYSVLSLAPMMVVILAIAGWLFGKQAAQGQLIWQIQDVVGPQAASAIQTIVDAAHRPATGAIATAAGLVTIFFGSTAVVNEMRDALNTIWRVDADNQASGWRSLMDQVRYRFLSFAVVVGVGFFLLVSLTFNAWVAAAGPYLSAHLPAPGWAMDAVNTIASFLVIALACATLYKTLPDAELEWTDVFVGALVTSALFTAGKSLIGLYLGRSTVTSAYGAAGSLVLVLLWVYYSAQVFFLGAEFTYAYTCRFGSKFRKKLAPVQPREDARPVLPEAPARDAADIVILEPLKSRKG